MTEKEKAQQITEKMKRNEPLTEEEQQFRVQQAKKLSMLLMAKQAILEQEAEDKK